MLTYIYSPKPSDEVGRHIPSFKPPEWFESARRPMWQQVSSLGDAGTQFGIVRHASYDYRAELFADADITITTAIQSVSISSAVCYQEAWQAGHLAIAVTVVLSNVGTNQAGKAPLNSAQKQYLHSLLVA